MSADDAPLSGMRVLLVEDESLVLMLLETMLLSMGAADVQVAMRLPQALEAAQQAAVDLAVLDLNLAGRCSRPVAEALRQRGAPVVFVSGYGPEAVRRTWPDAQAVAKPIDQAQFAEAVRAALTGR